MPYQGSTQSIGFRNRAVPNSSKRMKRKAKDLEQQRIDEVNSLTRQASGQITEMQRIDSVQSKKEAYDILEKNRLNKDNSEKKLLSCPPHKIKLILMLYLI